MSPSNFKELSIGSLRLAVLERSHHSRALVYDRLAVWRGLAQPPEQHCPERPILLNALLQETVTFTPCFSDPETAVFRWMSSKIRESWAGEHPSSDFLPRFLVVERRTRTEGYPAPAWSGCPSRGSYR